MAASLFRCPVTGEECYAFSERDAEVVLKCVECREECPGLLGGADPDGELWEQLRNIS